MVENRIRALYAGVGGESRAVEAEEKTEEIAEEQMLVVGEAKRGRR